MVKMTVLRIVRPSDNLETIDLLTGRIPLEEWFWGYGQGGHLLVGEWMTCVDKPAYTEFVKTLY